MGCKAVSEVPLCSKVSRVPGARYNPPEMPGSDPTRLDEARADSTRGRLKVFLGYASGVGKSFRMFDEARRRKERGQDVVSSI